MNKKYINDISPIPHKQGNVENVEELAFHQNLCEFMNEMGYIVALETGGKISCQDAYKQLKTIWKNLKNTSKSLGIYKKERK